MPTLFCWICSHKLCGNGKYFRIVTDSVGIQHRCHKICAESFKPDLTVQFKDKLPVEEL